MCFLTCLERQKWRPRPKICDFCSHTNQEIRFLIQFISSQGTSGTSSAFSFTKNKPHIFVKLFPSLTTSATQKWRPSPKDCGYR